MRGLIPLLLLSACAAPERCPPGLNQAQTATLFFGRSAAGQEVVSDAAWSGFLDDVVTPAFPDGLTVQDGQGQWRGRDGSLARERSKVLVLVLPGASTAEAVDRLAPIGAAYRLRFGQDSVLVTTTAGCAGF